jgi:hypothetical protein
MKSITKRRLKTRSIGRNTINRQHKRRHSNRRWNAKQDKSRKKRMIGGGITPPGSPRPQSPSGFPIFTGRRGRIQPESARQSPPHPPPPPSTGWDCDCKKSDKPPISTQFRCKASIGIFRENMKIVVNGIKLTNTRNHPLPNGLVHDDIIVSIRMINRGGSQRKAITIANVLQNSNDEEKWKIIEHSFNRIQDNHVGMSVVVQKIVRAEQGGHSSKIDYQDITIPIMPKSLWDNRWLYVDLIQQLNIIRQASVAKDKDLLRDIGLFIIKEPILSEDDIFDNRSSFQKMFGPFERSIEGAFRKNSILDIHSKDDLLAFGAKKETNLNKQVICDCHKKTSMPSEQPLAATNLTDVSVELKEYIDPDMFEV